MTQQTGNNRQSAGSADGVTLVPAPWTLHGKGYMLLYRLKRDFVDAHGGVPDFLAGRFAGGFGSLMLVDYADSDAGPYGEMLFIPGRFRYKNRKLHTISRIYVSTMASVVNGRRNWAIPKERADFRFEPLGGRRERVTVSVGDDVATELTLCAFGPAFPVNTALLPFPLVQRQGDMCYHTRFSGKGRGRLARVEAMRFSGTLFPDLAGVRPIAVLAVEPFEITFPVAEVEPADPAGAGAAR